MKKLVRDKIPEIVGRTTERVSGDTLEIFLANKIAEEFKEWELSLSSERDKKLEEIGDFFTAAIALANYHGFCWEEIEEEIKRKGKEKGGFGAGFVMEFD